MTMGPDEKRFLERVRSLRKELQQPTTTFTDLKAGDKVWVFSMYYGYDKLFNNYPEIHYMPKEITVSELDEYWTDDDGRPTHYLIIEEKPDGSHNSYGYIYEDDMDKDIQITDHELPECLEIVSLSKEKLIKELKKFLVRRIGDIMSDSAEEMEFSREESAEGEEIFMKFIRQIETL